MLEHANKSKTGKLRQLLEGREGLLRQTPLLTAILGERYFSALDAHGTPRPDVEARKNAQRAQLVRHLIEFGARLDAKDVAGNTAVHYAGGEMATMLSFEMLLDMMLGGANVNARNRLGETALLRATTVSPTYVVASKLMEYGADLDIASNDPIFTPRKAMPVSLLKKLKTVSALPREMWEVGRRNEY